MQISPNATIRELVRVRSEIVQIERRLGGHRARPGLDLLLARAERSIISRDPEQLQKSYDELRSLK